jgi:hypothetical protein
MEEIIMKRYLEYEKTLSYIADGGLRKEVNIPIKTPEELDMFDKVVKSVENYVSGRITKILQQ